MLKWRKADWRHFEKYGVLQSINWGLYPALQLFCFKISYDCDSSPSHVLFYLLYSLYLRLHFLFLVGWSWLFGSPVQISSFSCRKDSSWGCHFTPLDISSCERSCQQALHFKPRGSLIFRSEHLSCPILSRLPKPHAWVDQFDFWEYKPKPKTSFTCQLDFEFIDFHKASFYLHFHCGSCLRLICLFLGSGEDGFQGCRFMFFDFEVLIRALIFWHWRQLWLR